MVRKVLTYPTEYMHSELSIEDAKEVIFALHDAIDIAEQGNRADLIEVSPTTVAVIKATKQYENEQVVCTVVPDCQVLKLKVIED